MEPNKATYAGIGSRQTPSHILNQMEQIGRCLAQQGLVLRTGNCRGADRAFQQGANGINPRLVELFLPWLGYESESITLGNVVHTPGRLAYRVVAQHHPAWHKCSPAMQDMHARNAQIILGARLTDPVGYVICWTPGGKAVGGTAMGIRIAQAYGILVRNLAEAGLEKRVNSQTSFDW